MNDFNNIHALYHSNIAKEEIERRKRNYDVINTDFLQDLPMVIRDVLDRIRWDYGNRKWFAEAWEKYRKMVLDAGLGGKIKMPGAVFNEYLDKYELKELEKTYDGTVVAYHSDMYVDDYIEHHGIKGQKWGIRRYQNEDGTLTAEGLVRYGVDKHGQMSSEGRKLYDQDTRTDRKTSDKKRKVKGLVAGAAVGASVVIGSYAVGELLHKHGSDSTKDFANALVKVGGKVTTKTYKSGGTTVYDTKSRLSVGKVLATAHLAGIIGKTVAKYVNKHKAAQQIQKEKNTQQYLDSIEYQRRIEKQRK